MELGTAADGPGMRVVERLLRLRLGSAARRKESSRERCGSREERPLGSGTITSVGPPKRFCSAVGAVALAAAVTPSAALAHGDKVPTSRLGSAWEASPPVLAATGVALVLFVQAFVRLRRRGRPDHAGWTRPALFCAGLALAVLALLSPLDAIGDEYLLSGHMLQHVLIADAAPALILLALRGPLTFFLLPKPVLRVLAPVVPLRAALRFLLRPSVSFVLWCVVILGWHVPAAYDLTLEDGIVHDLEHASFVFAGTLAWIQLVDPARHARLRATGRILFAVGLLLAGHAIVDWLFFDSSAAYEAYGAQDERLLGLSPVGDQQLAAVVMFVEQVLTLGTCVVVLLWPYVRVWRRRARVVAVG
jgi:cytochrome c oxidase assembly factor CtaG